MNNHQSVGTDQKFGRLQPNLGGSNIYNRRSQEVGQSKYYGSSNEGLFARRPRKSKKSVENVEVKTPPKEEFNPNDPYELATPRFDNSYAPDQSVMTAEWKTSSDKKKDEQHYEE